ncbi:hypothetical protein HRG_011088 [Hirsutella rhossiliensis]|uniref:Uncharacterized protein n=1 Tax=Hirsutella rhossiliensis TaxID=111463 RepID=A0A9P8SE40_9HYPO|nr:uncharacterized protein HRG_11088 [Hirsutella rhossiliensis]KAH0957995.1 hypothetical protein HRG_11088 [Hirsutella rhossiliensis]
MGEREASEKIEGAQGPRTGTEKLASSLGLLNGGSGSRAVVADNSQTSTNRGTAQFWNMPAAQRDVAMAPPVPDGLTTKDRVMDWWTRRAEDRDFNARVRADRGGTLDGGESRKGSTIGAASQFRPPQLGLNFDSSGSLDPFSDNNASSYNATYATQLAQVSPLNPFADTGKRTFSTDQPSAIPPRAHGRSQSTSVRDTYYPPRSMAFRPDSAFRESLQSVTPFADRRHKGRSDPFDLEIESRLVPSADDVAQMPRLTRMSSNYSSHTRGTSLPYSQYSSGVSLSDWSIMGADVRLSTGPTMGEQGRPGELARWSSDKGRAQGGRGVEQAM